MLGNWLFVICSLVRMNFSVYMMRKNAIPFFRSQHNNMNWTSSSTKIYIGPFDNYMSLSIWFLFCFWLFLHSIRCQQQWICMRSVIERTKNKQSRDNMMFAKGKKNRTVFVVLFTSFRVSCESNQNWNRIKSNRLDLVAMLSI